MRLSILDRGHGFGTKALFALIRAASRQPVLDIIKLVDVEVALDELQIVPLQYAEAGEMANIKGTGRPGSEPRSCSC